MTRDLLPVKQDDVDIVATTLEEFWFLRDVHFPQHEIDLLLAARDHLLGALAQMAVGLGVDGGLVHIGALSVRRGAPEYKESLRCTLLTL